MFLGKVVGQADSDGNSSDENQSRLKIVQKLDLYRNASGQSTIAVDFIGANRGDIVIVGPPSASVGIGPLSIAHSLPPDSMIMGILDGGKQHPTGNKSAG